MPWLRGEGRGVVDDLVNAGLGTCELIEGRVPIGATALPAWPGREVAPVPGGDAPVGEELLVRVGPMLVLGLDCGLALLLARDRAWESVGCEVPSAEPGAGRP